MIYKISNCLVNYLDKNNVLVEDREIYEYGMKLFLSTILGTLFLLIVGKLSNCFVEAIIYEIIMSSSRSIMGGYHCKSYSHCIMMYVGLFILTIFLTYIFEFTFIQITLLSIGTLSLVYKRCPIQNINKESSNFKLRLFKKYSVIYITVYLIISLYLYFVNNRYMNFLFCMLIIINILIEGGTIDYEKNKK